MVIPTDMETAIVMVIVVTTLAMAATLAVAFKSMKMVTIVEATAKEGEPINVQRQHYKCSMTNFVAYMASSK